MAEKKAFWRFVLTKSPNSTQTSYSDRSGGTGRLLLENQRQTFADGLDTFEDAATGVGSGRFPPIGIVA